MTFGNYANRMFSGTPIQIWPVMNCSYRNKALSWLGWWSSYVRTLIHSHQPSRNNISVNFKMEVSVLSVIES